MPTTTHALTMPIDSDARPTMTLELTDIRNLLDSGGAETGPPTSSTLGDPRLHQRLMPTKVRIPVVPIPSQLRGRRVAQGSSTRL